MQGQRIVVFLSVLLALIWPRAARSNSISDVRLSPSRPASLSHGEEIKITFKYSTNHAGGVRIFPRPTTGGRRSPNYAASGSPLYPTGSGSGSGHFTIRTGDVFVDGVRFEICTDDRDEKGNRKLLHHQTTPVRYRFSDDPFRGAVIDGKNRYLRPDGVLEIRNPDGSASLYTPGGRRGYRTANGEDRWFMATITKLDPPVLVSEGNAKWIEHLNKWLEAVGAGLLKSIEELAGDPASFQNYKQYEDTHCQTLYQRIDMRQTFLHLLVQEP